MVNALQIIGTFPLLRVVCPASVYYLMKNIAKIAGFEVIPPGDIIDVVFPKGFTETESVNQGWD
jgi:hypothetical protein